MNNTEALSFFENLAKDETKGAKSVKLAKSSDFSQIDANFIMKYAYQTSEILDLGSGTGLVINKIHDKVKHITAVEPFVGFTKYISKSSNIKIYNQNIFDYDNGEETSFDMVTIFAVMHYFNESEATQIYTNAYHFLKPQGKIIIKNQFGVQEDVEVCGYSEEQKTDYFAHYRYYQKEMDILQKIGYKNIECIDIYPPEYNRWDNTHFYAIVAEK